MIVVRSMDNRKIGKLIASLRKKQGLTQQDLGDKVGVGFRAVSKWERGLTLPDISIINELSKILGISSDELLTGEISKENKPKKNKISIKVKIIISILTSIILIFSLIFIYYSNKTYVYNIATENKEEIYVQGSVLFNKNNMSIIINEIKFKDVEFSSQKIKNYEYDISSGGKYIYRYGYIPTMDNLDEIVTIKEFCKTFSVNNITKIIVGRKEIINNGIDINLKFLDENDNVIEKKIEVLLDLKKEK